MASTDVEITRAGSKIRISSGDTGGTSPYLLPSDVQLTYNAGASPTVTIIYKTINGALSMPIIVPIAELSIGGITIINQTVFDDQVAAVFINPNNGSGGTVDTVASVGEMEGYIGDSEALIVTDILRGGTFVHYAGTITNDYGKVFPKSGGGHWVRVVEVANEINVRWYGAKGDGVTDDLAALNAALNNDWYYGKVLYFPYGNYIISDTWEIVGQVTIQGDGAALSQVSQITPSPSFPAGNPLITIEGGYSAIRDIRTDMNLLGGNWVTFIGEGGYSFVERCIVLQVAAGYWAIELQDPGGPNGIAGMNITENQFLNFEGGAIWGNGGGDSNNILRNFFQLINSSSHLLLWDGVAGASHLNFSENNGGGAAKFIEINFAIQPKIMKNQLEALAIVTNPSEAMIALNGNCLGATISDNNLNCHSGNAEVGIYLDDVQWCLISNNTTSGDTYSIQTTVNTTDVTLIKGFSEGTIDDVGTAITILN